MSTKFVLIGALLSATLSGPAIGRLAAQDLEEQAFVRRFSLGATLSVSGLPFIKDRTTGEFTETPPFDAIYTTKGGKQRAGYGVTGQLAITDRFALNAGAFYRRSGYTMNSDIIQGIDNPNTAADERIFTNRDEDTRYRFYDFPVLVRFYGTDRFEPGPRWFLEGGITARRIAKIKTTVTTTVGTADPVITTTPTEPARQYQRGFTAGFGVQLIDPVGIRIIPSVRYTRWNGSFYQFFSTATDRNQVEGMLTLSF